MIAIEKEKDLLTVTVFGELTLSDYDELEVAILGSLKKAKRIRLLLDLTKMAGFTLDVAWEDIKFVGSHSHDFARIAVVTDDQWLTWMSWLNGAFTDAEIKVFSDTGEASAWIHGAFGD